MSFNRGKIKVQSTAKKKTKNSPWSKDAIMDPAGQWKFPGQITRILGGNITMQGVPYQTYGVPYFNDGTKGQGVMMQPGQDYIFKDKNGELAKYVDEFPKTQQQPFHQMPDGTWMPGEEHEELDLTEEEIQAYRDGGYVVEELPKAQSGWLVPPNESVQDRTSTIHPRGVVERIQSDKFQKEREEDYKKAKETYDDIPFEEKYGTSPHKYKYDTDPSYREETHKNAKITSEKYGSVDYPSTHLLSKKYSGAPNLAFMNPNKLTGEALRNAEEYHMGIIEAGLPLPGLEKLGKIPGVIETVGKGLKDVSKTLKQEAIYRAIDPVGYGGMEKIKNAPKNLIEYTLDPKKKMYKTAASFTAPQLSTAKQKSKHIESLASNLRKFDENPNWYRNLSTTEKMGMPSESEMRDLLKTAKNRDDAWRVGLGLDQTYGTFDKVGDNYRIKNMAPKPGHFSRIHKDAQAFDLNKSNAPYWGVNPLSQLTADHNALVPLTKAQKMKREIAKYMDVSSTGPTDYSREGIQKRVEQAKKAAEDRINKHDPWKQVRAVEDAKDKGFTHSIYDADDQGIMGGYRWDVGTTPEGNLHYRSSDTWDLHPWAKRGAINDKEYIDQLSDRLASKNRKKLLEDVEMLGVLGGKPYDIQNNFIVDPKSYEILDKFELGGAYEELELTDEEAAEYRRRGYRIEQV